MTGPRSTARLKYAAFTVAAAAMVAMMLGWGQRGADAAGDAPDLYIDVAGVPGCTTNSQPPPAAAGDVECDIAQGRQFAVRGFLRSFDGLPDLDNNGTAGYAGAQFRLVYTAGLTRIDHLGDTEFGPAGAPYWPDCALRTELPDSGAHLLVCLGLGGSTFVGQILEVGFICTDAGQQTITLEDALSYLHDEAHQPGPEKDGDEVLTITCGSAPGESDGGGPVEGGGLGQGGTAGNATLPKAGSAPAGGSAVGAGEVAAILAAAAAALAALGGGIWALRRRRRVRA